MAGILDNKNRIMDTIITTSGRRQISSGRLRVEYASFTDGGTFYEADEVSGSWGGALSGSLNIISGSEQSTGSL